jgi:spore coat polysaccharide biosynthesis protein SpsF
MIIAIIQARMGSKRLPGKVLLKLNSSPLLMYQYNRVNKSKLISKIIIATSSKEIDNPIVDFCINNDINYFRGDENDVLSRYYECAIKYKATIVVRITADCPLIDPTVIDNVINKFIFDRVDYCANTAPPQTSTFPDGSDVEVFSMKALSNANSSITDKHYREHVTFQFWKDSNYASSQLRLERNYSAYRYTVDYEEDVAVIKFLIKYLEDNELSGSIEEITMILDKNPQIKKINSNYSFGIGWKQNNPE